MPKRTGPKKAKAPTKEEGPDPILMAQACRVLEKGVKLYDDGDFQGAAPFLEEANSLMVRAGAGPEDLFDTVLMLARVYSKTCVVDKTEARSKEAIALMQRGGFPAASKGWAFFLYGVALFLKGDYMSALVQLERAIPLFEAGKDKAGIAYAYLNIGNINHYSCHFSKAIVYNDKAFRLFQEVGMEREMLKIRNNIALAKVEQGEYKEALKVIEVVLEGSTRLGDRVLMATASSNLGYIHLQMEQYDVALKHYEDSTRIGKDIGHQMVVSYSTIGMVEVLIARGDIDGAQRLLDDSVKVLMASKASDLMGRTFRARGMLYRERGDLKKAEDDFALAEKQLGAINYKIFLSELYIEWARAAMKAKDEKRARELFGKARAIYSELRLPLLEKELEMAMKQAGL